VSNLYESKGLIFQNRELVVPSNYRLKMMKVLHQGHQSKGHMLKKAKDVFWPGMARDFAEHMAKCEYCQIHQPSQQKQPMMLIEVPSAPGLAIGLDYFSHA
jgi:hypothetical protein